MISLMPEADPWRRQGNYVRPACKVTVKIEHENGVDFDEFVFMSSDVALKYKSSPKDDRSIDWEFSGCAKIVQPRQSELSVEARKPKRPDF